MSKLDDLIGELCPDGVEYSKFGNIANIVRGASPRPISNFVTDDVDGVNWIKIGDVHPESKYITSTMEKITKEGASKSRIVKPGDFVLSNSMSFGRPYIMKITGCIHDGWLSIGNFEKTYTSDFLYYLLSSNVVQKAMAQRASNGTVKNLNADIVKSLKLPLPPLPVQEEIVRILDNFTELTSKLTAELTAELTARKQQYEYYSNQVFLKAGKNSGWKAVGDVIMSLKTGLNPRQNFKLNDGGSLPYITGKDIFGNRINVTERTDKITEDALFLINKRAQLEKGDVLFASTGTGTVGRMAVIEDYQNDWGISETLYAMKTKSDMINPLYLMYALYSPSSKKQFEPKISKGSVPHLKVADLLKVSIPVPSINEQMQIVSLVKRFDTLCNDISIGLSAEIKARQKQYEYYSDKLLTFKEIEK